MVAHELRTPLTAATLALQSQQLGQIDHSRFQDVLKRRLEEIALLSKDLLEVGSTRWEAMFNPQRLNLATVAAEAILELEKQWLGRDVTVQTDIPTDLPKVYADQRRMRRVLLNLLENALKFTQDGGQVSDHAAPHQPVVAGECVTADRASRPRNGRSFSTVCAPSDLK